MIDDHIYLLDYLTFSEADRDTLDWSGRKPLDYRKQSTSVSASTYSSKYANASNMNVVTSMQTMDHTIASHDYGLGGTLKSKRSKRFSTMNNSMMRTQSMRGFIKSPVTSSFTMPKRTTYFSPELDQGKRHQKNYRSILFRKKVIPSMKNEVDK